MNIPERLQMHVSIQTNELYVKSYYNDESGSMQNNAFVTVAQVTFENVNKNVTGAIPNQSPVNFKITVPADITSASISADLLDRIRIIVDIIANKQESDQPYVSISFSDGNRIIMLIGSRTDNPDYNYFYTVPLLQLAGSSVKIKAYGAMYSFTFPESDDTASWLLLLSNGIIAFSKE